MDALEAAHTQIAKELAPIGRIQIGLDKYADLVFPADPQTSLRIKSFVQNNGLYNPRCRKWTSFLRAKSSLTNLCAQLATTIEAIIGYFNIPDRKVVWREPLHRAGQLTPDPQVMIVGRGGTAFGSRDFLGDMNYAACATPIAVRLTNDLPPDDTAAQLGIFAQYVVILFLFLSKSPLMSRQKQYPSSTKSALCQHHVTRSQWHSVLPF